MNSSEGERMKKQDIQAYRDAEAEKCADSCFSDVADEGDEQAHFQNGVEFGFKQGFDEGHALAMKQAEMLLKALKDCAHTKHRPGFCTICDALDSWAKFTEVEK